MPTDLAGIHAWEALMHPEDAVCVMAGFAAHIGGNSTSIETECRLWDKSGDWCWVSNRGGVVERNGDGSALRATGTHLGITPRKEAESNNAFLEAQLRQAGLAKC